MPSSRTALRLDSPWVDLCPLDHLAAGRGSVFDFRDRCVVVFRVGDAVTVLDDVCPHAGAPLSGGAVVDDPDAGPCVVCPLHAWAFRLRDGRCPDNEAIGVRVYESRVVDGVVQVRLA